MWFKGKKTAKEKGKKIISQLCQQHGTKLLAKLGFSPAKHASFAKRVPLPTTLSSGFANSQEKLLAKP
jgi:hypothetical protein